MVIDYEFIVYLVILTKRNSFVVLEYLCVLLEIFADHSGTREAINVESVFKIVFDEVIVLGPFINIHASFTQLKHTSVRKADIVRNRCSKEIIELLLIIFTHSVRLMLLVSVHHFFDYFVSMRFENLLSDRLVAIRVICNISLMSTPFDEGEGVSNRRLIRSEFISEEREFVTELVISHMLTRVVVSLCN